MRQVKTFFLLLTLFSDGCAQKSKTTWHRKPTAIIQLKQEDDLLGKWIGADEIENPLQVRWVVTTQKGRGVLIFSQIGRLVGKWAGDKEAQQQVDSFEEAVNRLRRYTNAQKAHSRYGNLAFATTRFGIEELEEQFLFGKYRDREPRPLDPAKSVKHEPPPTAETIEWKKRNGLQDDAEEERYRQHKTVKDNLLLEEVILAVFRERVDGVNLVSNPIWVAPHGNPNLTMTFDGEKGSKRRLRVFSQNFITPSSVGIQKDEVWSGTIKVNWGGEPLYTQKVSRAEPRAWFRILWDGEAIMYLDIEGGLVNNRSEKHIGSTYSGGMKMLLFVK